MNTVKDIINKYKYLLKLIWLVQPISFAIKYREQLLKTPLILWSLSIYFVATILLIYFSFTEKYNKTYLLVSLIYFFFLGYFFSINNILKFQSSILGILIFIITSILALKKIYTISSKRITERSDFKNILIILGIAVILINAERIVNLFKETNYNLYVFLSCLLLGLLFVLVSIAFSSIIDYFKKKI